MRARRPLALRRPGRRPAHQRQTGLHRSRRGVGGSGTLRGARGRAVSLTSAKSCSIPRTYATLEQSGVLYDTVLHEIAHVLGFGLGSLWDRLLREPSGARVSGQDTHFRGEAAVAAFDRAGGTSYAGRKVPVENDTSRYGRGALDTHWRESVFGAELMTTTVAIEDGAEPLSEGDHRGAGGSGLRGRLPQGTTLPAASGHVTAAVGTGRGTRHSPVPRRAAGADSGGLAG